MLVSSSIRGVSLTHPVLVSFLSGGFLFHIQCWLHFYLGSFSYTSRADSPPPPPPPHLGSFSYTSRAGFIFIWGVSLTLPMLALYHLGIFSYTSHTGFLSGEFLLHIPCWLYIFFFYLGSFCYTSHVSFIFFSYTSRAGFIFIWWVSLTYSVLASFLSGEFLLNIPCWLHFHLGSFSYTPVLTSFHISGVFIYLFVIFTHPVPALFLSREFLLHIPC